MKYKSILMSAVFIVVIWGIRQTNAAPKTTKPEIASTITAAATAACDAKCEFLYAQCNKIAMYAGDEEYYTNCSDIFGITSSCSDVCDSEHSTLDDSFQSDFDKWNTTGSAWGDMKVECTE